ncbi:MAG: oligopeptidase B [Candidatus Wallbacteria bacterium HGW-Wallbacteria-1]|uniref:Oligopeptidase B n=1 Tax=Candidatus Wallbacteria bacterium HGW-Wallbacteria-1 TaxID=2013854 RepID=A0A2N1PLT9_9BACT|nr:MAG: oligopeptidase B [Candidatus Wallbacteria bacterium HGW-Wallbacteria-1]
MEPPIAEKIPHAFSIHGITIEDPYFWLRDRKKPEVKTYLKAENSYSKKVLKPLDGLADTIYGEMVGRIQETDQSVPIRKDRFLYYSRTVKGLEYPIYCRRSVAADAPEEITVDLNELAKGEKYMDLGLHKVSPSGDLLAFSTDTDGSEEYTLHIRKLSSFDETGKDGSLFGETIEKVIDLEWGRDDTGFYYVIIDDANRPYRLYWHALGTDPSTDIMLYEEKDQAYYLDLGKGSDRKWIFLTSGSSVTSEIMFKSIDAPAAEPLKMMVPRRDDIEYYADSRGDDFIIRTNENAREYRLMKAPASNPARENWVEIIPQREAITLEDFDIFRDYLVCYERVDGLNRIRVFKFSGEGLPVDDYYIDFDEQAYTATGYSNPEFETSELIFSYESMTTPESIFSFSMDTRQRTLLKQYEVLGGYDPANYVCERVKVRATDGSMVPMSLVYRKGANLDGRNPCFLYGYGSYGICVDPGFSSSVVSLLDRGFVYAIAHIRGSATMGQNWHDDGKMLTKRNSFLDFINCAEYLVRKGYTSSDRLSIEGGSAGGLLMGAVTNMRPELFAAVIADVPFVDVINTMLDESLPLTVTEFDEWGNPKEKAYFQYMRSYCPYTNVKKQDYPHMLVLAGLNDPRVSYWEPAKLVAKIREMNTSDSTILLKTNMDAGHGGASGRYEYLREKAQKFAFIIGFGVPAAK